MGNDTPFYPHVKCEKCGTITVRWGRGGRWFIGALFGLLLASGTMTYKVADAEDDTEIVKKNVVILNSNIGKIDERQRFSEARDKLMAAQVQILLDNADVTEHPTLPQVEESALEKLETE